MQQGLFQFVHAASLRMKCDFVTTDYTDGTDESPGASEFSATALLQESEQGPARLGPGSREAMRTILRSSA